MHPLVNKFIQRTAELTGAQEDLVHKIASWQGKGAKKATHTGSTIELSGLGRFTARMHVVEENIQTYKRMEEYYIRQLETLTKDDAEWYPNYKRLKSVRAELDFLATKKIDPSLIKYREKLKNGRKENIRGNEQLHMDEGGSREDCCGENGDM